MNSALQALWHSRCRRDVLQAASLLGGCAVVAVVGVLLAVNGSAGAQQENLLEQANVAGAQQLDVTGTDMATQMSQLVADTNRLQQAGFAKAADRVAWVDAAVRTLDRLHPLAYTVEASVARRLPVADSLQQRYQQAGLDPPEFERNDLLLKIQGLQEDELADVIEQISAQAGGMVRAEHCKLGRRADGVGLDAECTLGRYRLRAAGAEPTS